MTQFKDWMTADDVLYGRKFPGRKIVVIGGGSVGCETADYLAPVLEMTVSPRNREITLIEMAHEIMEAESGPGRSLLVQRMMEKGIRFSAMQKSGRSQSYRDQIYKRWKRLTRLQMPIHSFLQWDTVRLTL